MLVKPVECSQKSARDWPHHELLSECWRSAAQKIARLAAVRRGHGSVYARRESTTEAKVRACAGQRARRYQIDLGAWWQSKAETAGLQSGLWNAPEPRRDASSRDNLRGTETYPTCTWRVSPIATRAERVSSDASSSGASMFALTARRIAAARSLLRAYSVAAPTGLDMGEKNIFSKLAERFQPTALNVQDVSGV